MSKYILAIDQGTTGSTVLIFSRDGSIAARAYSEFKQIYPKPGWVEHDANEIWQTTRSVIQQAKMQHIRVVFASPQFNQSNAERIAREINGHVVSIDPMEKKYVENMTYIGSVLVEAFE